VCHGWNRKNALRGTTPLNWKEQPDEETYRVLEEERKRRADNQRKFAGGALTRLSQMPASAAETAIAKAKESFLLEPDTYYDQAI
jgi:hypothetical protein